MVLFDASDLNRLDLPEQVVSELACWIAERLADLGHPVCDEAVFGPMPGFLAEVFALNERLTTAS